MLRKLSSWLVVVGSLLASPHWAAESPGFVERVDVGLVVVDVLVTDAEGRPILDLAQVDFSVFEDGRPVTISQFTPARQPSGVAEGTPQTPGAVPRDPQRLVIFLDNLHLKPASRRRTLEQLAEVLRAQLGPQDEAMIVGYDGTVRVLLEMTQDRSALQRVLKEQLRYGAVTLMAGLDEDRALQLIENRHAETTDGGRSDPCVDLGFIARTHAEQVHGRVLNTISALRHFVNSLAAYPGRKALLHVSDGIPLVAGEPAYRFAIELCDGTGAISGIARGVDTATFGSGVNTRWNPRTAWAELEEFNSTTEWTHLAADANAYQVSFYTLQASGASPSRSASVDGARMTMRSEMEARSNLQDSLFLLADETGGRAMLDSYDARPGLERMLGEAALRYELAYAPPTPSDGKEHRLKVEVGRPGASVRHRQSYRSKSLHEQAADRVLASLYHGREDNPLGVRLEVGQRLEGEGRPRVRLRILVPLDRLVLLPEGGVGTGLFTIFVAARDDEGLMTPVGQRTVPVRVSSESPQRQFVYEVEVPLPGSGRHEVAVALRDEVGDEVAYLRERVGS